MKNRYRSRNITPRAVLILGVYFGVYLRFDTAKYSAKQDSTKQICKKIPTINIL